MPAMASRREERNCWGVGREDEEEGISVSPVVVARGWMSCAASQGYD